MGANQTSYTEADGWSGSAIQLECGAYEALRFHLRLFRAGAWTLANAHFETIIPGNQEHQVPSWEQAQQFVTGDIIRGYEGDRDHGEVEQIPAVSEEAQGARRVSSDPDGDLDDERRLRKPVEDVRPATEYRQQGDRKSKRHFRHVGPRCTRWRRPVKRAC
jgi:hypothetical protein